MRDRGRNGPAVWIFTLLALIVLVAACRESEPVAQDIPEDTSTEADPTPADDPSPAATSQPGVETDEPDTPTSDSDPDQPGAGTDESDPGSGDSDTGASDDTGGREPDTGGDDAGDTDDQSTGTPAADEPDDPSGDPGGGQDPDPGEGDGNGGFAWVPWGPADPGDPAPFQWYGHLERGNCDGLASGLVDREVNPLWHAVAAVCAAAIDGDADQWAAAVATAENADLDGASCLELAAVALLERALAWHEANPGRQPEVTMPSQGTGLACPFEIASVRMVDDFWEPTGAPLEGPLTGGDLVALTGPGLVDPIEVRIGAQEAEIVDSELLGDGPTVFVRTPPVDEPGEAEIRFSNYVGELVAPTTFAYVDDEPEAVQEE